MRTQLTILLSIAFSPAPAPGQAIPPSSSCTFDTLAHSAPVELTYSLLPSVAVLTDSVASMTAFSYALTIAAHFTPPRILSLAYWPTRLSGAASRAYADDPFTDFGLGGELTFTLDSTGHLRLPPVAPNTNAAALNEALVIALQEAEAAGEFLPPPHLAAFPQGLVALRIHASRRVPSTAVPLMRARVQALFIDEPVRLLDRPTLTFPKLKYHQPLRTTVMFDFVVDATGKVVPSSIRLEEAEYREFIEASAHALFKMRFSPARAAGCPVPARLRQRFKFVQH